MTDARLRRCFLEATRLLLLAGVVASFLVPLWRERVAGAGSGDEEPGATSRALLPALGRALTIDLDDLGSRDSYPYALVGGAWVVRIGLVLLVVGLAALLVLAVSDHARELGSGRRLVVVLSIGAVVLGVAAAWLGTAWLPDDDLDVALAPSVLLPLAVAVWAGFDLRWASRLDDA